MANSGDELNRQRLVHPADNPRRIPGPCPATSPAPAAGSEPAMPDRRPGAAPSRFSAYGQPTGYGDPQAYGQQVGGTDPMASYEAMMTAPPPMQRSRPHDLRRCRGQSSSASVPAPAGALLQHVSCRPPSRWPACPSAACDLGLARSPSSRRRCAPAQSRSLAH